MVVKAQGTRNQCRWHYLPKEEFSDQWGDRVFYFYIFKCQRFFFYLCSRNCPPCIVTDQSPPASHSPLTRPGHYGLQCLCETKMTVVVISVACLEPNRLPGVKWPSLHQYNPNPETVSVLLMFTCVRSVCSPDRPALYWADRQTEWGRPGPGCTSSPEGMNAAADEKQKHRELYSEIFFIYFYSSIWYDVYLYYKWPTILYLNLGYFQGTAIDEQQVL